ncbi:MAG TPA: hypothetical protein VLB29_03805 [Nocardioidaceae bacterium]|nr:hypothetical protein [Nocardioidaceae bacterium]
MGLGTGVGLVAAGAVLTWALDVDLPYIDDDALGAVLLVAGVVAVVAAAVMRAQRPGTSPEPGLALLTVGAALLWAVDIDIPYVYDGALGLILLAGGIATVGAAVAMNQPRAERRQVAYRA